MDSPGLISYDNYWTRIQGDSTLRSDPDVREVIEKSEVLLDRVEYSFQKPTYKPMAKRIVQALSVFRLTTDDLRVRIGMTPSEMRDQLFLFDKNCDMDVEFLDATIESTLREILKSVSYQFISTNQENGQYYLDLDKDIPVDDHIASKSETLSGEQLNRYYFQVLERVLECTLVPLLQGIEYGSMNLIGISTRLLDLVINSLERLMSGQLHSLSVITIFIFSKLLIFLSITTRRNQMKCFLCSIQKTKN